MSSNYNESNLVIIRSQDRLGSSVSTSDFTVNVGNKLEAQSFAVKSISLTNIQYNVTKYNNTFQFTEGASPSDTYLTVPEGQYTTTTLLAALKTLIDTAINPETVTFTQSSLTQKITATFPSAMTIKATGVGKLIGYLTDTSSGTVLLADGVPNLQGTYNYYIKTTSDTGSQATLSDQSQVVILSEVPNTVSFGYQIIYEPNDFQFGKQRFAKPRQLKEMKFSVLDDNMNVVDLQGTDVIIVLKLFASA